MSADLSADLAADLVLASAMAQVPPEQIASWAVVVWRPDGAVSVRTDRCCIHHAGQALAASVGPDMARLTPCQASGG